MNSALQSALLVNQSGTPNSAPRIMPDQKRLLFTSKRKQGMGGYDIWMTERNNALSKWSGITNLSAFNTFGNEAYLIPDWINKEIYVSASFNNNFDIYKYIGTNSAVIKFFK